MIEIDCGVPSDERGAESTLFDGDESVRLVASGPKQTDGRMF
jgi:hypothetical protein